MKKSAKSYHNLNTISEFKSKHPYSIAGIREGMLGNYRSLPSLVFRSSLDSCSCTIRKRIEDNMHLWCDHVIWQLWISFVLRIPLLLHKEEQMFSQWHLFTQVILWNQHKEQRISLHQLTHSLQTLKIKLNWSKGTKTLHNTLQLCSYVTTASVFSGHITGHKQE